ncbi:hypothetical protein GGX14DRAFT_339424, partial [Mycena pura]
VVVVPFALPGETIRVKVYRKCSNAFRRRSAGITTPNLELRDNSRVQCKYFGTCGGCQYQVRGHSPLTLHISRPLHRCYRTEKQLNLKRDATLPPIESTMPTPKQYNYRTKIAPHFEAP